VQANPLGKFSVAVEQTLIVLACASRGATAIHERETGQSSTVPIAVLTPKQLEVFLQSEFKRLVQEAGAKGARIHVERAMAADYEQVLREVAACLLSAKKARAA
jgi:hypothetical protein